MDFDVNIANTVCGKDRTAVNSDLDADVGRERARINANEDDTVRGRLTGYSNAKRGHAGTLDPLILHRAPHGGTNSVLPDLLEQMRAERL